MAPGALLWSCPPAPGISQVRCTGLLPETIRRFFPASRPTCRTASSSALPAPRRRKPSSTSNSVRYSGVFSGVSPGRKRVCAAAWAHPTSLPPASAANPQRFSPKKRRRKSAFSKGLYSTSPLAEQSASSARAASASAGVRGRMMKSMALLRQYSRYFVTLSPKRRTGSRLLAMSSSAVMAPVRYTSVPRSLSTA